MKLKIETFRGSNQRLYANLYVNGRLVATKPAERVIDNKPVGERHQYNLLKVFNIHFPFMTLEHRLQLLSGQEVELSEEECSREVIAKQY